MIDITHKDLEESNEIEIDGIEFVKVVRCKDCKHNKGTKIWLGGDVTIDCDNGMGYPPPDWFCKDGKRKGEQE